MMRLRYARGLACAKPKKMPCIFLAFFTPPPRKVGRLADLSLNMIVTIENGFNKNRAIDSLSEIAKALEIEVDDLMQK